MNATLTNPVSALRSHGQLKVTPETPWLGLRSFTEDEHDYFFGRDREIHELFERVVHRPLTVLFGQSGLGKTSLLRAGLIPRLRDAGYQPILIRLVHDVGALPLEQQVVAKIYHWFLQTVRGRPRDPFPDIGLWQLFHDPDFGLVGSSHAKGMQPVLIFDQFEEIFTLGEDKRPEDASIFFESLACLVENRPPAAIREALEHDDDLADRLLLSSQPCKVLLTLRDDFLHRLERWRRQMPSMMDNRLELRPLSGPQAYHAVYEPGTLRASVPNLPYANGKSEIANRKSQVPIVAAETARAIVRFVAGKKADVPLEEIENVPPLLSLICEQLNSRRLKKGDENIHAEALEQSAPEVLKEFYSGCFASQPLAVREFIEDELISASGFRESITRDTAVSQLHRAGVANPEAALCALVDQRLLVDDERGGISRIELTHDILAPIGAASRVERAEHAALAEIERGLAEQRRADRAVMVEAKRHHVKLFHKSLVVMGAMGLVAVAMLALWLRSLQDRDRAQLAEKKAVKAELRANYERIAQATQAGLLGRAIHAYWLVYDTLRQDPQPSADISSRLFSARRGIGFLASRLGNPLVHDGTVQCIAVSNSGKIVATGCTDGTARLWDKETSSLVGQAFGQQDFTPIKAIAFNEDDSMVIIAKGNTMSMWSTLNQAEQLPPLTVEKDSIVRDIALTRDGKTLFAAHANEVSSWKIAGREKNALEFCHPCDDTVNAIALTSGGTLLLTGTQDGSVHCWDVATGSESRPPLRLEDLVNDVAFNKDGSTFATASDDGLVAIWNHDLKQLCPPLRYRAAALAVAFSPCGKYLLTGTADGTVDLLDAQTGKPISSPFRHEDQVLAVAFTPCNDATVFSAGRDFTCRFRPIEAFKPSFAFTDVEDKVWSVAFSTEGQRIAAGCDNGVALVWERENGSWKRITKIQHEGRTKAVLSVAFSPQGNQLLTGGNNDAVHLWDLPEGTPSFAPIPLGNAVRAVAFSPDGRHFATGTHGTTDIGVCIWEWDGWKATKKSEKLMDGSVHHIAFNPDGTTLVNTERPWFADVWRVGRDGQLDKHHRLEHDSTVFDVAFSPDGTSLYTGSWDSAFRAWDPTSGKLQREPLLHYNTHVISVAVGHDGKTLATGCTDGTVRLIDSEAWVQRGTIAQYSNWTRTIAFSPDGKMLLVGTDDGHLDLWEIPRAALDDPQRLRLSIEVRTGSHRDDETGVITRMSSQDWLKQKQSLAQLGGPCDGVVDTR